MFDRLTTQTAYKTFAFLGLTIVVLSPYLAWQYISGIEPEATTIFEQSILNRLDLESTQLHFLSIKNAIAANRHKPDDPDAISYSASEVEHLQAEAINLSNQIEQLTIDGRTLMAAKKALVTDIKMAFAITLITMIVAMLLAVFGLLGWSFHIRIYQERRNEPRKE